MRKALLLLILSILSHLTSTAQTEVVFVKGDFFNKPLIEFLQEIENKNGIQFHYINDVVKDITVSGLFQTNTPFLEALETMLKDKPVSFARNDNGEVILFANPKKALKKQVKFYSLTGQVISKQTGEPLPYVTVHIPELSKGAVTDAVGKFEIKPFPEGSHLIQFSYVGYKTIVRKINAEANIDLNIQLEENMRALSELIITPSSFQISTIEATPPTIGKEEILHSPNMGKDIYRTLRALPGVANNDFSAKARIRGGHSDETAVYLDNFMINDAFHLEEIDGSFSIFNTDYIDELTVFTGGFSARYTDRLSGIIDVKTSDNIEADKYRLSIDLMNASFLAQKKLNSKTNIFFTARRGYLDFLLASMQTDDTDALEPRFSDFWAKVSYKANAENSLSFNVLVGRDNFLVKDVDEFVAQLDLQSVRDNVNGWINWKWFPRNDFNSITTLGFQHIEKKAKFTFAENLKLDNTDKNNSESLVFTNNSYWNVNATDNFEFGIESRLFTSQYQYNESRYEVFNSTKNNIVTRDIDIDKTITGYTGSGFIQYNWKPHKKIIIQPGIRASSQSFSPDLKFGPRVALSYDITPSFNTRWAYGIYYQPDQYFKMRTALSQQDLYNTNGKATHYTGSLTFSKNKTNVMLNLYYKKYHELFDDYRFEFFNRMGGVNILDVPFQTTGGYAQGVEMMVRQNYGKNSMISISYAYAESKITNNAGQNTFRDFDQPHTIIVNNIFRLPLHWNISLFWTYHTGYPYTPTKVDFITYRNEQEGIILFYEAGLKNSKRLPDFHSLDLRIEKSWYIKKHTLTTYLNIINFYNRENLRSYWWFPYRSDGRINFENETQSNIPFFISPGISFTFY